MSDVRIDGKIAESLQMKRFKHAAKMLWKYQMAELSAKRGTRRWTRKVRYYERLFGL